MVIHVKKEKRMPKVFIIAEAGVNHNGSLKIAKRMIDAAAKAGADAIKFQTFQAKSLVSKRAPKAAYQKRTTANNETQLEMLSRLELNLKDHEELISHCRNKRIKFLSSAFDLESIGLLNRLKLNVFKIPSGEITNLPYLRKIGSLHKSCILSTGMSDLQEIKEALKILVLSGTKKENITVLHCNTEYPTPFKDVHLLAMLTIKKELGVKVGYSDHTSGIEVALAAVALGATVIEKHFTLDKNLKGPDHQASLDPEELSKMVASIRNIESALGSGIKKMSPSEADNAAIVRKSIVAAVDIKKGDILGVKNLAVKRPEGGISPMKWDTVLGKVAKKNFDRDEFIKI